MGSTSLCLSICSISNKHIQPCSRLELSLNGEYCVSPGISDTTPGGKEELLSIDGVKRNCLILRGQQDHKQEIVHTQSSNRLVLFNNW